jgi:DNA-binding transcriptional MerR regulator
MESAVALRLEAGYPTSRVAKLAGLSFRQLDYYVRIGLLTPSARGARGSGSYRLWTEADISRARLVGALRSLGATTDVLARVLGQLPDDPSEWPGWLFISPEGEVRDLHPQGPAWWGIAIARLLEREKAVA